MMILVRCFGDAPSPPSYQTVVPGGYAASRFGLCFLSFSGHAANEGKHRSSAARISGASADRIAAGGNDGEFAEACVFISLIAAARRPSASIP
jgi:hypothetical protein